MRYVGQSFELTAPLPDRIASSLAPVLDAFYGVYQDVYGYVDHESPVEIVDLRVQVVGITPKPQTTARRRGGVSGPERRLPAATRTVYWAGRHVAASVYTSARPCSPGIA